MTAPEQTCGTCTKWEEPRADDRSARDLAAAGLKACTEGERWVYLGGHHPCRFNPPRHVRRQP